VLEAADVKLRTIEVFRVGPEVDRRPGIAFPDRPDDFQVRFLFPAGEGHRVFLAVATNPDLQLL
jgi:hypothetical protein